MRVLVTGAGSGVGKATAMLLAGRGHEVIATARDRAMLDDLDVAARLHLDVTEAASVDEVRRELDWVDALVNNAAISFHGPIEHVAMGQVQEMFETNVLGPVRLIQAFVPGMRSRRSGVVVNISSVAGHVAQPLSGYSAMAWLNSARACSRRPNWSNSTPRLLCVCASSCVSDPYCSAH